MAFWIQQRNSNNFTYPIENVQIRPVLYESNEQKVSQNLSCPW